MAKRRRRGPEVLNAMGQLGSVASDFAWSASTDPNFMEAQVPNDTPLPDDNSVVATMRDFPQGGTTTWMSPTQAAIVGGKVQAALDTVAATGAQLTAAGEQIIGVAGGIVNNIVPILLGLAALWFFMEKGKQ